MKITGGKIYVQHFEIAYESYGPCAGMAGVLTKVSTELTLFVDGFPVSISVPRTPTDDNGDKLYNAFRDGTPLTEIEI